MKKQFDNKIVIIGAGPCGLGAAKRLTELGYNNWMLFEREGFAGGLAASFIDERDFTWDTGGHVTFSHYPEFDKMLEETCGGELLYHQRKSFVKVVNSFVPYPFQNNLRYLPKEKAFEALSGLKVAPGGNPSMPLDEWMEKTFGSGIYQLFMHPYNQKVWATDPSQLSSSWIAERISVVNYDQALRCYILEEDNVDWGPNSTFIFPLKGGTGEIFRRLAALLPSNNIHYNTEIAHLNIKKRELELIDGSVVDYDILISTMPLNELIRRSTDAPESVRGEALQLRYSGTYVVGCGFDMPLSDDWCWMYFPESDVPFNRVTNFAHYSPFNVPHGHTNQYCAFMCETSFSDTKPEDRKAVIQATWKGLFDSSLVRDSAQKVTEYVKKVPYAYPVPSLNRDIALRIIQPYLMEQGIYSRGRFGAWMYEIGNMDHSYKQGRDVVDYILDKKGETVWQLK
jgi:protoporphyrinogen oxidase